MALTSRHIFLQGPSPIVLDAEEEPEVHFPRWDNPVLEAGACIVWRLFLTFEVAGRARCP